MTDEAIGIFDRHAAAYGAQRRRLVPSFDAFYGAAVGALELAERAPGRVLDLGAGTGLLSLAIAERHPRAELVLLDGSGAMLAEARGTLGEREARFIVGDMSGSLPAGPWDAIVSALAIHHLEDDGKRALFTRAFRALSPDGLFVNADQVLAPTPALAEAYLDWHRRRAFELGATADEWTQARARMSADRCATVEDQLAWLRVAGFVDVDCVFKDHGLAVLVARRGALAA